MFNHYSNSYPLRKTLFHWFIIFFSHNFHQSLYTSCFFFIGCYTISYRKISPTSMATTAVCFCVALSLATFFALSPVAVSSISASPPVSPHRTYQNMSSFFPSVDEHSSPISADPASAPGSGEFMGKSGSSDVKLNHGVSAFGLNICSLFSLRVFLSVWFVYSDAARAFIVLFGLKVSCLDLCALRFYWLKCIVTFICVFWNSFELC